MSGCRPTTRASNRGDGTRAGASRTCRAPATTGTTRRARRRVLGMVWNAAAAAACARVGHACWSHVGRSRGWRYLGSLLGAGCCSCVCITALCAAIMRCNCGGGCRCLSRPPTPASSSMCGHWQHGAWQVRRRGWRHAWRGLRSVDRPLRALAQAAYVPSRSWPACMQSCPWAATAIACSAASRTRSTATRRCTPSRAGPLRCTCVPTAPSSPTTSSTARSSSTRTSRPSRRTASGATTQRSR